MVVAGVDAAAAAAVVGTGSAVGSVLSLAAAST